MLSHIFMFWNIFFFSCVAQQLLFQMCTDEMQETFNFKTKGDSAFKQKDFKCTTECYAQVSIETIPQHYDMLFLLALNKSTFPSICYITFI